MTDSHKLKHLRALMKEEGVDAYIVPRTDEYQGEFVAPYAERLKWLTGFSGSAGMALIAHDRAIVMSDARYTIQLAQQVDQSLYALGDHTKTRVQDWVKPDEVVGYDPHLHTIQEVRAWEASGLNLHPLGQNLIDLIWEDQPSRPDGEIEPFPDDLAGQNASKKIIEMCKENAGVGYWLFTACDSIAWLTNTRGNDIDYTPVSHGFAVLDIVHKVLKRDEIPHDLRGKKVAMDFALTPVRYKNILEEEGAILVDEKDPCAQKRACKNEAEIEAIRKAHMQDGVAVVRFLKWLEDRPIGTISEMDAAQKIEAFRAETLGYRGASFPTISGFAENGAIVHYRATPETSRTIDGDNLLLVDSGGQYLDAENGIAGTTDITRTVAIGTASEAMKKHYTLVLKAHVALSMAYFSAKTTGRDLDAVCRTPLRAAGLDFAHGTGHGVGCYLQVHEEAAKGISPRADKPLSIGMLLSNEPGYYEEGAYGIRIENLVHVQARSEGGWCFETITLAPYDRHLIVPEMLDDAELAWVNGYHQRVYDTLAPHLDEEHQQWLDAATQAIAR